MTRKQYFGQVALGGLIGIALLTAPAMAKEMKKVRLVIPAQSLSDALTEFARQSHQQLLFSPDLVANRKANSLKGNYTPEEALRHLLSGTGLTIRATSSGAFLLTAAKQPSASRMPSSAPSAASYMRAANTPNNASTAELSAQPSAIDQAPSTVAVEDIVVTAQRRTEKLQNIPISITALNAEALDAVGFKQPNDILAVVPSVQVNEIYGKFQPVFTIRGLGQSDFNANQSTPVGIYADEAYIDEPFLHGLNFFDVERLEVLKGPQGTLHGKNTTAGAINLISRTPKIDDGAHTNFTLSYGNYDAKYLEGGVEGTLVPDKLALRVAGFYTDDDGWQRNVTLGTKLAENDAWGVRSSLVFEPSDNLQMILRYTHGEADQTPTNPVSLGQLPTPGGTYVDFNGYSRPATLGYGEFESDVRDYLKIKYNLVTLTSTFNANHFDIVSVSSFHDSDKVLRQNADGNPFQMLDYSYGNKTKAYSQDLRFVTTDDGPFNIIAGLYYGYNRNATHNIFNLYSSSLTGLEDFYTPLLGAPAASFINSFLTQFGTIEARQTLKHNSFAAYSQARWEFAPQFGLDIGLRYTRDKDEQSFYNVSRFDANGTPIGSYVPGNITFGTENPRNSAIDAAYTTFLTGPYTPASAPAISVKNNRLTGKISLDYKPNIDTMLYASYSRGYRSGNFTAGLAYIFLQPDEGAYASPETIDAYEIGLKTDLLDRRLRFNLAGFWYDYTNQQFVDLQGVSAVLRNAGKSRIKGIEAEIVARPAESLTISLAGTYLDARYTELSLTTTDLYGSAITLDLEGNWLSAAPKFSGVISVDHVLPVNDGWDLNSHIDANYRTKQWFSPYNGYTSPTFPVGYSRIGEKAYGLVNARLSLESSEGLAFAVWSKNLLNQRYKSYAINVAGAEGSDYIGLGTPRTYGVELSYEF